MVETWLIDHVGQRGDGVAPTPGGPRFVPYTLPGETVEVDVGSGDRARLLKVIEASAKRVAPFCPHFGACGGCAIQHWTHADYLAWKHGLVVTALAQAGIAAQVKPMIDAHGAGRRRITLHARRGTDGKISVGFAAAQSHAIVPIDVCPILDPGLRGALEAARAIAHALIPANKPLDIQVTAATEGLDIDVRGSGPLEGRLVTALSVLADKHRIARITRHGDMIVQRHPPSIAIGRARVTLPAGSFLQATAAGQAALAAEVLGHPGGAKTVADLFCGIGPFALRLSETAKVAAYDSEATAIAALNKAATGTAKLRQVIATARDLFRRPLMPTELRAFDAIVFDPPRQGAQAQAMQLAQSKVGLVVAVSCNVTTFARDAAILIAGGYRIGEVTPIDQFRHTPHVELVAAFRR